MEDLARELDRQAGLYILYGDEGVGKTRLLSELTDSRLAGRKIRWMDLQAGSNSDGALVDSSILIEKTFARARSGDVIVADHFEMALKKTRHQLFLSWSTDGIDKNLSLVIAASSDYCNELKQLVQQYQVPVQSFEQVPFNAEETAAFLGFYLFPDRAVGELLIPPLLRNQLVAAQGNIGKIIEIAERAGDQISIAPVNDSKSSRQGSSKIVGAVVAAALLLAVSWYYLASQQASPVPLPEPVAQVSAGSDSVVAGNELDSMPVDTGPGGATEVVKAASVAELALAEVTEPAAVQANNAVASKTDDALPGAVPASSPAADAEVDSKAAAEVADASLLEPAPPVQTDEPPADTAAAASDASENTEVFETATATVAAGSDLLQPTAWASARLRQDLQASLDWIGARETKTSTLQIMLLSQDKFNEQVYYEHLVQLAGQGVDISRIRIFESYTGNRAVLSVVYGEYPSRAAANDAKPGLPPVLREIGPIARSVGGLLVEIERLREQN